MKVVLDECIPRKFMNFLTGHECQTVPQVGLAGKKNGELLRSIEAAGFELFITVDQGIEYQQNITGRGISILIIRAKSNRLYHLFPFVDECNAAIRSIQPGQIAHVGWAMS